MTSLLMIITNIMEWLITSELGLFMMFTGGCLIPLLAGIYIEQLD